MQHTDYKNTPGITGQTPDRANEILNEIVKSEPSIKFREPNNIDYSRVLTLSDASHRLHGSEYGQMGSIRGIIIEDKELKESLYYGISWTRNKQRSISHFSFGAELIAAGDNDDMGCCLKETINEMFPPGEMMHELVVDSKSLSDTISSIHKNKEYRLRETVLRLRVAFQSGDTNNIRWVQGKLNFSDALTKRNVGISQ